MTTKQQIATGFLAALIICSVAFMPASADSSAATSKPIAKHAPSVVATKTATEHPSVEPQKDLTYN
jgi:hypothetical protein